MRGMLIVMALALAASVAGCAVQPLMGPPQPPPSEEVRAAFGRMGIRAAAADCPFGFQPPARGWCDGALRGAWLGTKHCLFAAAAGASGGGDPLGTAAWVGACLALSPVAALAGGIYGGIAAPDPEDVDGAEAALKSAFGDMEIQEDFRILVLQEAKAETSENLSLCAGPEDAFDTLLELGVLDVRLQGEWGVNPSQTLVVLVGARVLRAADGEPLHSMKLAYGGPSLDFLQWGAGEAAAFRTEVRRAIEECAARIVEDLFLLRLIQRPSEGP